MPVRGRCTRRSRSTWPLQGEAGGALRMATPTGSPPALLTLGPTTDTPPPTLDTPSGAAEQAYQRSRGYGPRPRRPHPGGHLVVARYDDHRAPLRLGAHEAADQVVRARARLREEHTHPAPAQRRPRLDVGAVEHARGLRARACHE